ncbi:uncharacterized protein PHACADRAFT_172756 [Phanerochaete carnosa HHB-10118-sp]|uniref:Uncharacterized protein n=1 Tax=Phanerochaete carnosa (strain HHB-10118-sp) TaxID=650164 RepID=K5WDG8_PHACS|nr:uncharacterized protein PHACADRAFT_172756 [Phanerochaete carnosa HHB-10118-sp]EKM57074.1 hypothetical protein PHACADRAFT_172756 [Phanerochaete carnosa HHB-10118-sp]
MFAGSRVVQGSSGLSGTRVFSPPAPISVPPPESPQFDFLPEGSSSPSTELAGPQTFPETPYAFTPLVSAGFLTPRLPRGTGTPERAITTPLRNGRPPRSGIGRQVLMRHTLAANSPVSAELSTRMPMTPPPSGSDVPLAPLHEAVDALPVPGSADALSMIEECNSPVSHKSQPSLYSNTPEHSPAPLSRSRPISRLSVEVPSVAVAEQPSSLVLTKRSLPSLPSPPPTSFSLPPSPSFSPAEPEHELVEERSGKVADEPLASITENRSDELPENKSASSSSALPSIPVEPFEIVQRVLRARPQPLPPVMSRTTSSVHGTRSRPPPPSGPRRPSGPAFHLSKSRSRNGSVSSSLGSPPANTTTSNAANLLNKGTPPPFSSSSPRFQTQPVKFRGLTLEAAQWTWTREQLQETVSAAIKKSADPSSTRLLSTEVLEEQIPQDIQRLEVLSAELRTNYKLAVRKRRMLLDSLRVIADGGELAEQAVSARLVDDLTDLSDQMSHLSEELYVVTDQLSQLHHLQDIHFGSALAMALHKLNNSLIKHLREKDHLQQQVASLEAERDDGWRHAEEAARELDDLSEKVAMNEGVLTPASSRRSSKISIARKVSVRRAGLRSPSRLRVASNSAIAPPSIRATSGDIPPVPPIPLRTPLALSTSDLPGRSAGLTDDYTPLTPYSETRAMQKAQEELCKMLGISPEDLRGSPIRTHNKRSLSLSATMQNPRNVHSFVSRRKSEIHTPNTGASDGFRIHRHSQNINDRTVVLAAIGMASA